MNGCVSGCGDGRIDRPGHSVAAYVFFVVLFDSYCSLHYSVFRF
jgi:hypothetical protein